MDPNFLTQTSPLPNVLARYLESRFHFTAPYLACELLLVGISASFSLLFVVPKLQKSLGDLTLMRLGMVANTISVALFGLIWQPWQVGVGEIIMKNRVESNGTS